MGKWNHSAMYWITTKYTYLCIMIWMLESVLGYKEKTTEKMHSVFPSHRQKWTNAGRNTYYPPDIWTHETVCIMDNSMAAAPIWEKLVVHLAWECLYHITVTHEKHCRQHNMSTPRQSDTTAYHFKWRRSSSYVLGLRKVLRYHFCTIICSSLYRCPKDKRCTLNWIHNTWTVERIRTIIHLQWWQDRTKTAQLAHWLFWASVSTAPATKSTLQSTQGRLAYGVWSRGGGECK